jgi:hypothetical protein
MLVAILHCIPDTDDPYGIVTRLREAVPPGSYLVISHPANDIQAEQMGAMAKSLNRVMAQKVTPRSYADVSRFFDGLELVEPGIVRAYGVAAGPGVRRRHRRLHDVERHRAVPLIRRCRRPPRRL